MSTMSIGLFFCIMPLAYTVGSVLMKYTPLWIAKRTQCQFATFFSFVGFICVGPSASLSFPNSIPLMAFGHALGGFMSAHASQTCIIEMIEEATERFPAWEQLVAAMSVAAYSSQMGTAMLIAPIYGTAVTKALGFKLCMDSIAYIDLGFFLAYFIFAQGPSGLTLTWKQFRNRNRITVNEI